VSWLRFKLGTFGVEVRSVTAGVRFLSVNRMVCGISNNKRDFIFISNILRTSKINVTNKEGSDFKTSEDCKKTCLF